MPGKIYWNDILQGYNDKYGTYFTTLYALMHDLYKQYQSCEKMDVVLGVGRNTIHRKLRELEIPIQGRGWSDDRIGTKMRRIREIDENKVKHMTSDEIAKEVGCSRQQVWAVVRKFGIKYNKQRRRVSH